MAPPLIEKLMTFTPSRIACWTAAAESLLKQPCVPADLVHDHVRARGDARDGAARDAEDAGGHAGVPGGGAGGMCAVPIVIARVVYSSGNKAMTAS